MNKVHKNPWTTLSKEQVYDNPWIGVAHHKVITPGGTDGVYGVIHFKNLATGVVALDEEDNIYLVGQYRYPLEKYSWELPEGGCPEGESPLEAAKRELLEEAGVKAKHWELLMEIDMSNSITDEHCHTFLAKGLEKGQSNPEDTEELKVKKVPFEEALEMVLHGEITDAISVAAILKAKIILEL